MDKSLPFAFDEKLGYLTRCPADLGTGLRASVLLTLPVLDSTGRCHELTSALGRTGHTLRRCGGGGVYLLSHRPTAGMDETEIIRALDAATRHIIDAERRARTSLDGEERACTVDRILRAEAVLKVTKRLSEEELPVLLTDLRLGAAMGILPDVRVDAITVSLIETQPAGLSSDGEGAGEGELAALRAQSVRERVFG